MSHPQSPRRPRWLRAPVRDRCDWLRHARSLVRRAAAVPTMAPHGQLFGSTFELCTVLDLAERMPYPHLLDALPTFEAIWTAWRTGFAPPLDDPAADFGRWNRREETAPAWLHAAGSNLAQLMPMLYRFGDTAEASRASLETWNSRVESFATRRRIAATEAPAFRAFWREHLAGPREMLQALGPVRAADVPFRGGRRMGDLIAGTSMVEIKTGRMEDQQLAEAVVQAVEYALLAEAEGYDVSDVVIYLARYGLVIQTPLQELADDLAGCRTDLADVRRALAHDDSPWPPNARGPHHQGRIE
ncbi:hypothetical protein [Dactylosporangium sp. CA-092794]|uniref:hypothetical protein n=1 Tax=Dactylosporangium sp. CA-092794 TaxID=3239929 RepID=UPI003D8E6E0C